MEETVKLIFGILLLLILINLVSPSSTIGIPDTGSGVIDLASGVMPDGSGSTDSEKWKQDKNTPKSWELYDKSLTSQLTLDQLNSNPIEARNLWNSNKLTEQQKIAIIQKNYGISVKELQGSFLINQDGKEILVMKNKVAVPLESFRGTGFNLDIDPLNPSYARVSDPSGKFKYLTDQGQLKGAGEISPEDSSFPFAGGPQESPSLGTGLNSGLGSNGKGGSDVLSIMQNIMGLVQNLLGSIKEAITTNAKGKSTVTSLGDNEKIVLEDGAEMSVKTMEEKDAEGKNKEVRLAQTDTSKKAEFILDSKLNSELKGNNIFVIPKIAAVITQPDTPTTTVIHNMAEIGSPGAITGAVIQEGVSKQFVKIVKHDIEMKGEKYEVYFFKPFNDLDVECSNVTIKNGDTLIIFQNEKMFYPRYLGNNTPYYVNMIKNQKDLENIFRLLQGGSNGNYLIDDNKIISVGDQIVSYPEEKGLIISKTRVKMWDYLK